ncbi:hypothetical protein F5B20DRAFT_94227 [Whalleya microplaca]|nr:hypothetical protein F5B20DRAFT_94227 [Whalleya microplaca]
MEGLDNNWGLDNFDPSQIGQSLTEVYLCALRNEFNEGDEAGEPPTNHWTLCLRTSINFSVMLNMVPGHGSDGLHGKIEVTSLDRRYTEETHRVFPFRITKEIDVAGFMQLLIRKGRQAFNFSPQWEGCQFWLSVVMQDLEDEGLVESGSAIVAREALMKYWRNPEGTEPRVMREGKFR